MGGDEADLTFIPSLQFYIKIFYIVITFGSRLCFSKIFDTEWPSEKVTVGRTDAARQWLRVRYRMDQWVGTRLIWLLFQAKSAHCRDFTNFLSHTKKCCFYAFSLSRQKTIKKDKKRAFFGFSPLVLWILRIFSFFSK